jgi:hypothetical protein
MDITTLVRTATDYLVPAIPPIGTAIAEGIGADLWNFTKRVFSLKKKENELTVLQAAPQDARQLGKIEYILEAAVKEEEGLLKELIALVEAAKAQQNTTKNNTTTITGNNNQVFQNIKGSNINIGNTTQHHHGTGDIVGGDKVVHNAYYGNKSVNTAGGEIWKEMIQENKISDAIGYLMGEHKSDADKCNTLLLLLGQYNYNESNIMKGVISKNDADLARNKVVNALLQMFG